MDAAIAPTRPAAPPSRPETHGYVDFHGTAQAAGGLLFCGWLRGGDELAGASACAVFERGRVVGVALACRYPRDDLAGEASGLALLLRGTAAPLGPLRALELRLADGGVRRLLAVQPPVHLREPELLSRVRQVIGAAGDAAAPLAARLSRRPFGGADTLGDLPVPVELGLDEVIAVPGGGVLAIGWLLDPTASVAAIRLCANGGATESLTARWLRLPRPDVVATAGARLGVTDARCGFLAWAPGPVFLPGAVLHGEVELAGGETGHRLSPMPVLRGVAAMRRAVDHLALATDEIAPAFDRVLGPPLAAINAARLAVPCAAAVLDFGSPPPDPDCSIIVPLHGRMDFLLYQLALLDPDRLARHELIYVLDDPPKRRELLDLAQSAARRFGTAFRVVTLDENRGYAPANNAGLRTARGEFTCFLNSDVVPDAPDWLERMIGALRRDPGLGVVGARLLFEDGTIQHDGMGFAPLPELAHWPFPMHPGKGRLPRGTAELAEAEAVTGACMVLRTALARELGGFDEAYAIGDFEDSDLCLRIRARGLRCAVDQQARLFHLERQSQVTPDKLWRFNITLLNAWTHTRRWFTPQGTTQAETVA